MTAIPPLAVVLAGPNGAGKSTSARELLVPLVDSWQVHGNAGETAPRLIAYRRLGQSPEVIDREAWEQLVKEAG